MKKCILFLLTVLAAGSMSTANAQCTPDPAINSTGGYIYPPKLPFAVANEQYNQVFTFRVPLDTTVVQSGLTVPVHVDSAKLVYISGRPSGYNYQCNTPGCVWNGGSLGCALLSGIGDTSKVGEYPMRVYVYTWAKLGSGGTPYERIDSSDYTFKILRPTGMFEIQPLVRLKAYPNPTKDMLTIELRDIQGSNNQLEVFDASGRRVFHKMFGRPSVYASSEQVDLSELSKGLYTVVLRSDEHTSITKVLHD